MSNNRAFTLLESLIALIIVLIILQFIMQLLYFFKAIHEEQDYYLNSIKLHLQYEFALAIDIECLEDQVYYTDKSNTPKVLTLSNQRLVRTYSGFEILLSDVDEISCTSESMIFRHRGEYNEVFFKP